MNRIIVAILAGLALGAGGTWLLTRHHAETESGEKEHHKAEAKESEPAHSPTTVKLSREMQTSAGVETAPPQPAEWKPELKGYGRVLDPAPLVAALFDIDTAQAALAATSKEHARLKALFAQNQNASLQALETAEAALRRDQLLVESARSRLLTAWGANLANRADLPELARTLASMRAALVRIDLMPGQSWKPTPTARLAPITSETFSEAEFIGPAPMADPVTQSLGFVFLMGTNTPAPGTAMLGLLPATGAPETGWRIPDRALVRHEGSAWFYTQTGDESFERQLLNSERRLSDGWFLISDVSATNRIVVTGAQLLLSEQLKSAGGEEE